MLRNLADFPKGRTAFAYWLAKAGGLVHGLFLCVTLGPILTLASIDYFHTYRDLTQDVMMRRQLTVRLSAAALKGRFEDLLRLASFVAQNDNLGALIEQEKWTEALQSLSWAPDNFPYIDLIFLADASGTRIADSRSSQMIGKDLTRENWYRAVAREWKPSISGVYQQSAEPPYDVFAVVVPIRSKKGDVLGILGLKIRVKIFLKWIERIPLGRDKAVHFFDSEGKPMVSLSGKTGYFFNGPKGQSLQRGLYGVEVMDGRRGGGKELAAYEFLRSYGWGVAITQPASIAFAVRERKLKSLFLMYALFFTLNAGLALIIFSALRMLNSVRKREEAFLQNIGDTVFAVGGSSCVTLWNRAAVQMTGWRDLEVLGKPFKDFIKLVDEKNGSDISHFLEQALSSGKEYNIEEDSILFRRDGTRLPVSGTAVPILGRTGTMRGSVVILRDVSAAKLARESLKKMNEELETRVRERTAELERAQQYLVQQERLRALGEMASGIAHDFNNTLSPILGYTELMMEAKDIREDPSKSLEFLKIIRTAAKDAAGVVGRMREFYRPREQHENPVPVSLNDVIRQVIELTQPKWKTQAQVQGTQIEIQTDLQEIPSIQGNPAELREVLTNLIFNSVDAMPGGGKILLWTSCKKNGIVLGIEDTGTGMTEEVRRRCFEPFFTTKGNEGSGLGLAMVYGIIRRHEGSVELVSAPGQGTRFAIRFPLRTVEGGVKSSGITHNTMPSLYILYVEDEPAVRDVVKECLERDGHRVDAFERGSVALDQFGKNKYDLVITDRAMPEMSGERLATAIKKISPKMPIILLSGTGDFFTPVSEFSDKFDAVLAKPVTLEVLRQAIAKVISDREADS